MVISPRGNVVNGNREPIYTQRQTKFISQTKKKIIRRERGKKRNRKKKKIIDREKRKRERVAVWLINR